MDNCITCAKPVEPLKGYGRPGHKECSSCFKKRINRNHGDYIKSFEEIYEGKLRES